MCILLYFIHLYCADVLTNQGTGVSEGSDLGVRQAREQVQQGGEEVLIKNEAIPTGPREDPNKLAQAGFETPQLGAWRAQRVVH